MEKKLEPYMSASDQNSIKDKVLGLVIVLMSRNVKTELDVTKLVNRIKSTAKDDIMKFLS